ncbi:MAG: YwqG family protein [Chloroflexota bacterium]
MERGIENLKKLIHEHGFGDIEDDLLKIARPSIRVQTTRVGDESELAIGQSKLGGRPDLPKDMDWVVKQTKKAEQRSLPFIGQINLADVAPHDVEKLLPTTGILYFFGDYPWNGVPESEQGAVIYYDGNTSNLERKLFPADLSLEDKPYDRFAPCSVMFIHEVNMDGARLDDFIRTLPLSASDFDVNQIYHLEEKTNYYGVRYVNRMLGVNYEVWIHDTMQECIKQEYHPNQQKEGDSQANWQLLFQVDSDKNANMLWLDAGIACFYIRKKDLAERNFDNVCFTIFST